MSIDLQADAGPLTGGARAIAAIRFCVPIDKGIPMPPKGRRGRLPGSVATARMPWRQMEVGDSFEFPRGNSRDLTTWLITAATAARRRAQRSEQFEARILNGRVRVWRTA